MTCRIGRQKWLVVAALLAVSLLAGCVSSTRDADRASMKEALQDYIQLGLGYLGEGDRDSARYHLQKAQKIDNRAPGVHNGLALLYQVEMEYELADEHYRKALSLDPRFTRARNNYGVFLYQRERYEEAYEQFSRAAADTDYRLRAQAFLSKGIVARQLGRQDEAVEAWRRALALNPRLATAYLELASHYYAQEDYVQARRMLEQYDERAQPSSRSLWLGVRIEHAFGNRDARESHAMALQKLFPYSSEALEYQQWLSDGRKN